MNQEEEEEQHRLSTISAFHALRERPFMFALLLVFLFAGLVLGGRIFSPAMPAPLIEAHLRLTPIEVDETAVDPASLVKSADFNLDNLLEFVLAGMALDRHGADKGSTPAAVSIKEGSEDGSVVISFRGFERPDNIVAHVNERLHTFADNLNVEQTRQRDKVRPWIRRSGMLLLAEIEEAKAAILQSPFDAGSPSIEDPLRAEKLLRLMLSATVEARVGLQAEANGSASNEWPHTEIASLAADATRMTTALSALEVRHAAQLKHVNALKKTEAKLAEFLRATADLQDASGLLNQPAVTILAPAAIKEAVWFRLTRVATTDWRSLLTSSALLSLLLALPMIALICIIWPKPAAITAADYLNNPNWPLEPGAYRELSN